MGKLFNFKSIKAKILSGFIIIMVILLLFSGFIYLAMDKMRDQSEAVVDKELPLLIADSNFANNMLEVRALTNLYLLTGDADVKKELMAAIDEGDEIEEYLLDISNSDELRDVIDRKGNWETTVNEAIDLYDKGNEDEALTFIRSTKADVDKMSTEIDDLKNNREDIIVKNGGSTVDNANNTIRATVVVIFIILIMSVIVALVTARTISNPIHRVMERMVDVSKGILNLEPLQVAGNDETARLTESTNTMTENNRELLQKISEVSSMVSSQSEQLTQSANEVKSGTEQVASTMEELASGAEIQANSASDLTNYMGSFTEKIEHTNDNNRAVHNSSEKVLSLTENGGEMMRSSSEQMNKINTIVHDSVDKMGTLNDHAQNVTKLVEVINEIAEQTNLLALNAAIEAARAGENGRGFAVVADEVRKLAEQVGLSVKDITEIVTNIQQESKNVSEALQNGFHEVEQGTEEIQLTEKTFGQITDQVNEMVDNIQVVSSNLNEIVTNNEKMGHSIEEIASVSEESAAGVEQTAASAEQSSSSMEEVSASSRHLATLAEELNGLVQQYQV
ncbi:MAG TPA: methyl-accepting chemotaxis protein [Pseudogracilibacillus sp.]|nr:methyl-accepting chemotaxis protein [Pseudogracilibacillus sp.]